MKLFKIFLALLASAVVGGVVGTLVSSVHMLTNLAALGVSLPASAIIKTFTSDIVGLTPTMAALLIPGFAIAFTAAHWLANAVPSQKTLIFSVAGAVSVLTTFITMKIVLGATGISAARSVTGLAGEAVAGLIAGLIFVSILNRIQSSSN